MGREPQTTEIEGLEVTSMPLPFAQAEPMLPDVAQFLALMLRELPAALAGIDLKALADGKIDIGKLDIGKLGPLLSTVAAHFGEGRLSKLAPKILATTSVLFEDVAGEREMKDLGKAKDRELVFDEYPAAYLLILFFAGRVTYQRFFPGIAQRGGETRSGSS